MANQTTMSAAANGRSEGIVGSVTGLGHDVTTLLELQAKLASIDAKQAAQKAAIPVAAIVTAVLFIPPALTVGLFGIATLVARSFAISEVSALLITAAVVLVLAGATIAFSVRRLAQSLTPLRRSSEELTRNFSWLRTVLLYSGRPAPRREV